MAARLIDRPAPHWRRQGIQDSNDGGSGGRAEPCGYSSRSPSSKETGAASRRQARMTDFRERISIRCPVRKNEIQRLDNRQRPLVQGRTIAIREMEGVVHFRLVSDQDRRSNNDFDDKDDQQPSAPVRSAPYHIARKLALAWLIKYMKHMLPEEKTVARAALAQGHGHGSKAKTPVMAPLWNQMHIVKR